MAVVSVSSIERLESNSKRVSSIIVLLLTLKMLGLVSHEIPGLTTVRK